MNDKQSIDSGERMDVQRSSKPLFAGSSPVTARYKNGRRSRGDWLCNFCNEKFRTKGELYKHKHKENHFPEKRTPGINQYTKAKIENKPKPIISQETRRKKGNVWRGKKLPEYMKQKISTTMKIKAENGEIGCWSNCHFSKRSYAEEWTKKVIENEFEDKKVIEQYHFERYRLDFAWPEKKKCIEIDGKQHETNLIQIESDKRKDERLKRARWQVLRLKWSWIFNNTQEAIIKMKNFINF